MGTVVEIYIGRKFKYLTANGEEREARCTDYKYHKGLDTIIFTGESPRGNVVRLTQSEVLFEKGVD